MVWAPDYITGEQLGSYLQQEDIDADADLLDDWASTASRNVDNHCGRQFGKTDTAEARTFDTTYDRSLGQYVASIDDLHSLDGLLVADVNATAFTVDQLLFFPHNAIAKGRPYERVALSSTGRITITSAFWGWPAVPAAVRIAAKLQGARLAYRRGAAHGIAGSPENGSETRLLAVLDADFRTSLKPYVRKWWAA